VAIRADRGAFTPPSELRSGLPPSIDAFFVQAFARSVDARPATARALAEAFVAAVEGKAPASGPSAALEQRVPEEQAPPSPDASTSTTRSVADRRLLALARTRRAPAAPRSRWISLAAFAAPAVLVGAWLLVRAVRDTPPAPTDVPEVADVAPAADPPPSGPALPILSAPPSTPGPAAAAENTAAAPTAGARAKIAPSTTPRAQQPSSGAAAKTAPAAPAASTETPPAPPAPSSKPAAGSNPFDGRY
jgi:hypothetical protein